MTTHWQSAAIAWCACAPAISKRPDRMSAIVDHTPSRGLSLAFRYALREMRSGLRGFYVFIACIALGVLAIAGVGSVASSLSDGLAREGRTLLGGDAAFSLI